MAVPSQVEVDTVLSDFESSDFGDMVSGGKNDCSSFLLLIDDINRNQGTFQFSLFLTVLSFVLSFGFNSQKTSMA